MAPVCIVATNVANLASVHACVDRLGCESVVTQDPKTIESAAHVILPGVGAFGACVRFIDGRGLREALHARLSGDRPTLGICLGMQLLGAGSEESLSVRGLGFVPSRARRFPDSHVVPHMGWNQVRVPKQYRILDSGYAYFANSFRWPASDGDRDWALSDYAGTFVAGFERGNIVGCQFHPELSGSYGAGIIRRFLRLEASC